MNEIIKLITVNKINNKRQEVYQEVFASTKSVTAKDFYLAGQQGHKPQIVFIVHKYEYNEQNIIDYNGKRYSVFRTYEIEDGRIELHCEVKIGKHN